MLREGLGSGVNESSGASRLASHLEGRRVPVCGDVGVIAPLQTSADQFRGGHSLVRVREKDVPVRLRPHIDERGARSAIALSGDAPSLTFVEVGHGREGGGHDHALNTSRLNATLVSSRFDRVVSVASSPWLP
jgi:hypothetical protein